MLKITRVESGSGTLYSRTRIRNKSFLIHKAVLFFLLAVGYAPGPVMRPDDFHLQ